MFGDENNSVNLKEWIRQQRMELRDKAFEDGNAKFLRVLDEVSEKEKEFIANSDDLLNKAIAHSETFNGLSIDDQEHVEFLLSETIFFIDFDE